MMIIIIGFNPRRNYCCLGR